VHVRFHLDEHISTALGDALRHQGIDVTTTRDAGLVGAADRDHLSFAASTGRHVVTLDVDFLRFDVDGVPHAVSLIATAIAQHGRNAATPCADSRRAVTGRHEEQSRVPLGGMWIGRNCIGFYVSHCDIAVRKLEHSLGLTA
jgi:predicted nuclease of predicted toxin-antitoxin system